MKRLLARVNIQRCGFHIFPPSILHFVRKMLIEKKKKADRAFFIPFRTVSDEKKRAYYIYTHNMMMNRSGRPKKKIKRPPQRCYNIPPSFSLPVIIIIIIIQLGLDIGLSTR